MRIHKLLPLIPLALFGCESELHLLEGDVEPEASVEAELGFAGDPTNNALYAVDVSHWEGPIAQHSMDCLWTSNVRHVVAGTQVEEITRQQLAMALRQGMSVDAYVYLYWDRDMTAQVQEAFRRVQGFPIGRLWLDIEDKATGGRSLAQLEALTQQAVDACRAHGSAECGLYTGRWYWRGYMSNTTSFADLPLWYALYDDRTSLSSWSTDKFGGWTAPVAKQWAERVLCGVGLDRNTMQVIATPQVVVDRTPAPSPTTVPAAPSGLWPSGRSGLSYLVMMVDTIPWATSYSFALEYWTGSRWTAYATWTGTQPSRKAYPRYSNRLYRFKVRAANAKGWGAWSGYANLEYGTWSGAMPPDWTTTPPTQPPPTQPPPTQPPPTQPPPAPGAPTGLTPDNNQSFTTSSITMKCDPVASATKYEFAIEYQSSGTWKSYFTYTPSGPQQTFWPSIRGGTPYRFTVRALVSGIWTPKSNAATFTAR